MILDESRFPLVILRGHEDMHGSPDEQEERNRQLENMLGRQIHFVLIVEDADHKHENETAEARKAKALFFKRIKSKMKTYCLGLVVIEGQSPVNAAARIAATAASKALGFTVQFAQDEESAVAKGLALLERHAA